MNCKIHTYGLFFFFTLPPSWLLILYLCYANSWPLVFVSTVFIQCFFMLVCTLRATNSWNQIPGVCVSTYLANIKPDFVSDFDREPSLLSRPGLSTPTGTG